MFLLLISAATLAIWVFLASFRDGFWLAGERLDPSPPPDAWPGVVAIIPARNEAETIGAAIASHMASDYPGEFSIVLVDDGSSDGTADAARAAGAVRSLEIVAAPRLPEGWTGKLAAMRAGLVAAAISAPDARYILFTDADIVHAPRTLRALVSKAEAEGLVLASLMARLDARGFWGGLLAPAFVYFFQKLYPFAAINDPSRDLAGAAGGCMLVRRARLEAKGGLEPIRDRIIDDCALGALLKGEPPTARIWLGLADEEVVSRRDNRSLGSFWKMVSRTAFAQLGHSGAALAGTVAGLAIVYLAPPAIVLSFPWHGAAAAAGIAGAAYILMTLTFQPMLSLYQKPPALAAFLPLAAALYLLMTVNSALRHWRGAGGAWKGRTYPARNKKGPA